MSMTQDGSNDNINTSNSINDNEKTTTETFKYFTIRGIPTALHKKWKMVCLNENITMEEYAMKAIEEKINREYAASNKL